MNNTQRTKVVVLYSGGLDSTTVLAMAINAGHDVLALSIDYNQSNRAELDCCRKLASLWKFPHIVERMNLLHCDTHGQIPARNTIFLSRALEYAISIGAKEVHYGAEPDATYTDSSVPYINAMHGVFALHDVVLKAPIKQLDGKLAVLQQALELGVPLDLVHSSLSNVVDGECKTSNRYLTALETLFPALSPKRVLLEIAEEHRYTNLCPSYLVGPSGSFKYLAALFSLSASTDTLTSLRVFTTGNWGRAMVKANWLLRRVDDLEVVQTDSVPLLGSNQFNTNSCPARWGIRQMLSRLPRPQYLEPNLTFIARKTQGHLHDNLRTLGYRVTTQAEVPLDSKDIYVPLTTEAVR